ncbi:hypothetical protein R1CP_36620 (plasmid) [Rhodococcus opacus]|uniref:Uncharacterized protein n=1 Tax=Rhodococcus opacus TaxID=37919 RepID=A0A1B1KH86_RHOOP|nr:hypothetical protein [Rhodococcus opacus]ANS31930.1 hypothetical protein R1CP_36620 [Rhodococcus opacus]
MAKYLLLKHYRGAPASANDVPLDQWTPEEISAQANHVGLVLRSTRLMFVRWTKADVPRNLH